MSGSGQGFSRGAVGAKGEEVARDSCLILSIVEGLHGFNRKTDGTEGTRVKDETAKISAL
jgi:hypothetical protein